MHASMMPRSKGGMTREEASAVYGPSTATPGKWVTQANKITLGKKDAELIRRVVTSLDIAKVGRPTYMSNASEELALGGQEEQQA